ncbi:MAG: hypothetical protein K2N51_16960 [Lachnospiraceae bacterium]|nr:hypothetical protein [Lachnospiraceae bacterium]
MAKITREQIEKINSGLKNGFKFDLERFFMWNEKSVIKQIKLDSEQVLQVSIHYTTGNEGEAIPTLHLHKGTIDGDFISFSGLGQSFQIGEPQKRRNFNFLAKLTANNSDESLISLAKIL